MEFDRESQHTKYEDAEITVFFDLANVSLLSYLNLMLEI